MRLARLTLVLLAFVGVFAAASVARPIEKSIVLVDTSPIETPIGSLLHSGQLAKLRNQSEVLHFYEARNFAPAWANAGDVRAAIAILQQSDADGLDPTTYRVHATPARDESSISARFDIELTDAVLAYIHDMRGGRLSRDRVGFDVGLSSAAFDAPEVLSRALANRAVASLPSALAPPHPEYARLKNALAQYRNLATVKAGQQIALQGDTAADADSSARADAIIANMERWRWLPNRFEDTYVEVNTADATLKVVRQGQVVLVSRLVTGKRSTPTPLFQALITGVTINPPWIIPASIARNEIWPKERRHPGYLASHHMVLDSARGGLRQLPGPGNSLGQIKLEMANQFNSYLHDTPAKALFAKEDRHFSHGCMRTEQIRPLASFALSGDTTSALERIQAAIATGETQRLSIEKPIPVYVLYWTAIAKEDGSVQFLPDVYGRDAKMLVALRGQSPIGRMALVTECAAFGRA